MPSKDTWSAELYNSTVPFVYSPSYTSPVLQLLDAKPGERIYDFGCGSGEVTLELQKIVGENGFVVGLDSSQSMVHIAASRGCPRKCEKSAEARRTFRYRNGRYHELHRYFLKSTTSVLNLMTTFVYAGIRSALHSVLRKYGIDPVPRDPWYFPSPDDYQNVRVLSPYRSLVVETALQLLEKHGFRVSHISLNPRFTPLKGNIRDWVELFCRSNFLKNMDAEQANRIMDEVNELCAIDCRDSKGRWSAMYARLRIVAVYE
jgi:SAM-dependent methyltransferase